MKRFVLMKCIHGPKSMTLVDTTVKKYDMPRAYKVIRAWEYETVGWCPVHTTGKYFIDEADSIEELIERHFEIFL